MTPDPLDYLSDHPSDLSDEAIASTNQLDMLTLPDQLQDIVRWMARRRAVTLADVAAQMQQDPETVLSMMNALVKRGLVQKLPTDDLPSAASNQSSLTEPLTEPFAESPDALPAALACRYQLHLGSKRDRRGSSSLWDELGG